MKINEIEKMLGISKANIRYYENEGLITPNRTENGYRDYNDADIKLLKKIIVYRKLGIPITEIQAVLNKNKALTDVITSSVNEMKKNIDHLDIAIEMCEEIKEQNLDDNNFDTDYFWNEIQNREANGDEFVNFGNIDISSYKNIKGIKTVLIVLVILFFFGIAYSLLCDVVFIRNDNENYKEILTEIETADTIDTVKINEKDSLIYVFYNDAGCINTYNLNGNFEWAISVPYNSDRGLTYFYFEDNQLLIDNKDDVYIYNAQNGEFMGKDYAEELGLIEKRDLYDVLHSEDVSNAEKNNIVFDIYNVSLIDDKGNIKKSIVNKPATILLKNYALGFLISLFAGFGIAIVSFINKVKQLKQIELNKTEIRKPAKAHHFINFLVLFVYIIFGLLNILLSLTNLANIAIGIFPATAIFIILFILYDIMKNRYNESELKYVGSVFHYLIIAYAILFATIIIFL